MFGLTVRGTTQQQTSINAGEDETLEETNVNVDAEGGETTSLMKPSIIT